MRNPRKDESSRGLASVWRLNEPGKRLRRLLFLVLVDDLVVDVLHLFVLLALGLAGAVTAGLAGCQFATLERTIYWLLSFQQGT